MVLGFEKAFCVNLQSRPDRRAHCERIFAKLGWDVELVPGIEAHHFKHVFHNTSANVGIVLTNLYLLQRARWERWRSFLLLEDDILVDKGIERINEYLQAVPKDWSLLYLGWITYLSHDTVPVNNLVSRVRGLNGAHALAFRDNVYAEAAAMLSSLYAHNDTVYGTLQTFFPAYCLSHNFITQGAFGSDANPDQRIPSPEVLSDYV